MTGNRICGAVPANTERLNKRNTRPFVISAKRFNAILARSGKDQTLDESVNEEYRYKQYLKEGNDALCKCFPMKTTLLPEEEDQANFYEMSRKVLEGSREQELHQQQLRTERIVKANKILESLKPCQRALRQAQVESEVIYQRKYNEALNQEISVNARQQERLDEQQCPERLIPFCNFTEQQLKAQQQEKSVTVRRQFLKDLEERQQRKLAEKEQEIYEGIIEREQYKCLQKKEEQAAKELAEKKREFCRRAYRESLKEKAEIKKHERICEQIENRIICVDVTKRRYLEARSNKAFKTMHTRVMPERDAWSKQICRMEQANTRKAQDLQEKLKNRYEFEVEIDEARRQCQKEELSNQRRAYELEERRQAEERRQRDAEIRRFAIADRLKNQETNNRFNSTEKRRKDKATADLRDQLHCQRDEFQEQRKDQQMRISACQPDLYLQQDVNFYDQALKVISEAHENGRPTLPMVKAVETYRRDNQIEMIPESRTNRRSRIRDYCWPGYHSKADLAYKKYEQREKCQRDQAAAQHQILMNCIKINKIAAEERPCKASVPESPVKCFQHRGMPAIESVDSFDCGSNVCYADDPQPGPCPSALEVMRTCDTNLQSIRPEAAPYISDTCPGSIEGNVLANTSNAKLKPHHGQAGSAKDSESSIHSKRTSSISTNNSSSPNHSGTLRKMHQAKKHKAPPKQPNQARMWR
ncbi:trichohyalin-like [Drosophila montana]|uniref:trichohyalin-like n=1 Tax=Drosophila montana TaxID=40370 RepID=UPI00313C967F